MADYIKDLVKKSGLDVDKVRYVRTAGDSQEDLGVERVKVTTYDVPTFFVEYEMVEGSDPYIPDQTNEKVLDSNGRVLATLRGIKELPKALREIF